MCPSLGEVSIFPGLAILISQVAGGHARCHMVSCSDLFSLAVTAGEGEQRRQDRQDVLERSVEVRAAAAPRRCPPRRLDTTGLNESY